MNKTFKLGLGFAALAGTLLSGIGSASAAPPPALPGNTTGFDEVNNIVNNGGSDTTYNVQVALANLYNASPGCDRNILTSPSDQCNGLTSGTNPSANWDHDVITNAFPTGSGAGRSCLVGTTPSGASGPVTCNLALTMARSSGRPGSGDITAGARPWGYARDGIGVVQFGTRTAALGATINIDDPADALTSKQILQNIYNCVNNPTTGQPYTWKDLGQDPAAPNANDPVIPVGMNSASGTASQFAATYLGFADIATLNSKPCVRSLTDAAGAKGAAPFENDAKQLSTNTTAPNAGVYTGPEATTPLSTLYSQGKLLWWMAYAPFKTLPYQRLTASMLKIDNKVISGGTIGNTGPTGWPIGRYVYQVSKAADANPCANATCAAPHNAYPLVGGATTGAGGAAREFLVWMCKNSADHTVDGDTGVSYFDEIEAAIVNAGFISVPAAQREWGRCRIS